jgi:hypothetical protein
MKSNRWILVAAAISLIAPGVSPTGCSFINEATTYHPPQRFDSNGKPMDEKTWELMGSGPFYPAQTEELTRQKREEEANVAAEQARREAATVAQRAEAKAKREAVMLGDIAEAGIILIANTLVIARIAPNSPAAQTGLLPRDRIIRFVNAGNEDGASFVVAVVREGEMQSQEFVFPAKKGLKTERAASMKASGGVPDCAGAGMMYLDPSQGASPKKDCLASMYGLEVVQKVDGGYLIQVSPYFQNLSARMTSMALPPFRLAFLKTKKNFGQGQGFDMSERMVWEGRHAYEAINGFTQSVLAFKFYAPTEHAMKVKKDPPVTSHPRSK